MTCSRGDPEPLAKLRYFFASRSGSSLLLVFSIAVVFVTLRVALLSRLGTTGFVSLIPPILIVSYLAGPGWGYVEEAILAAAIFFIEIAAHHHAVLPFSVFINIALFAISGAVIIEFVRLLNWTLSRALRERERAMALAEERQKLVEEMAHRTGNNFQMISSILMLAFRGTDEPTARRILKEASDRVLAMATVQRSLSHDPGSAIQLAAFLPVICGELEKSLGVNVICHCDDLGTVNSRLISPLALAAHELTANAVEHGTRPGRPLRLSVRLERRGLTHGALIVENDGRPVAPDFDPATCTSLGLSLVRSFADRIGGNLDVRNRPDGQGVIGIIEFPLDDQTVSPTPPAAVQEEEHQFTMTARRA